MKVTQRAIVKTTDEGTSLPASRIGQGARLMSAAISGLLAAGGVACGEDGDEGHEHESELSGEELAAVCEDLIDDALAEVEPAEDPATKPELAMSCADEVKTAEDSCQAKVKTAEDSCQDEVKTAEDKAKAAAEACLPLTATADEKTTQSEQKEYKFAELTKRCDESGGYVQIHAACGGVNTCRGFSFGDWGPDGALVNEHSCSGANGCNGLSCVVLPKDGGKSGKEVYDMEFTEPGPGACTNCHAEHNEAGETDVTKFKVIVAAGSTRTTANWLDRTAAEQERVVAFGAHGVLPSGIAYQNMSAYHQVLSRKEIERVVAHLRTLTPVMKEFKVADPTTP